MAESRRGCTPAQQSMSSSKLLACTSRFSAVVPELLISRHAPCNKLLFLVHKIHSRLIPKNYRESHRIPAKRLGFPEHLLVPGKDTAPSNILSALLCNFFDCKGVEQRDSTARARETLGNYFPCEFHLRF